MTKFHLQGAICLLIATLSSSNASIPHHLDDETGKLVQQIVRYENQPQDKEMVRKRLNFFCIALGCDTPVLEALHHSFSPSLTQVIDFLNYVQNNDINFPELPEEKNFSIKILGQELFDSQMKPKTELYFYFNKLTVLPHILGNLTHLTHLFLPNNNKVELCLLGSLINLTHLDLSENDIKDVSPLSTLSNLIYLNLSFNDITDVNSLRTLTNLTEITLSFNKISVLTFLMSFEKLDTCVIDNNKIEDFTPLSTLKHLQSLYCSKNPAVDSSMKIKAVLEMFSDKTEIHLNEQTLKGTKNIHQ